MSTIQPKGEKLRRAIRWISEEIAEHHNADLGELIQKASLRFNLSPKDELRLVSFYRRGKERNQD